MKANDYEPLVSEDEDGPFAVGWIDFYTGSLMFQEELDKATEYTTTDNQSYYSVKSKIPSKEELTVTDFVDSDDGEGNRVLVGYVRVSNSDDRLKLSVNVDAIEAIRTAQRHKGIKNPDQVWLSFNRKTLWRVVRGERAVTTLVSAVPPSFPHYISINRKSL